MNRKIKWLEVCFNKHILTMIIVSITSFVFVNFEIYNINYPSGINRLLKFLLFNLIYMMMVICIIKTIKSDPGRIPLIWNFTECAVRKYCVLCHNFKPPRSHHCSTCGRCVLNMDHHCPWLSNCVGFYNRKSFILSVMYGWLSLLTGIGICASRVLDYTCLTAQDLYIFFPFFFMICTLFVLVSIFFQFHLNLVFKNLTTIEHLERKRAIFQDNSINLYDLGCYTNTEQVLGQNIWLWLFPTEQINLKPNGIQWPEIKSNAKNFGNGQKYSLENSKIIANENLDSFKDQQRLNIIPKQTSDQWL